MKNFFLIVIVAGLMVSCQQKPKIAGADLPCLSNYSAEVLGAQFKTTVNDEELADSMWYYWREPKQVAKEYPSLELAEVWIKESERTLAFERLFSHYQRSITYTGGDLKSLNKYPTWEEVSQILAHKVWKLLDKKADMTYRCLVAEVYEGEDKQQNQLKLVWLPEMRLPAVFEIRNEDKTRVMLLTEIYPPPKSQAFFKQIRQYDPTDYADIGDNEADPFLSQMIRQGFIEHPSGEHPHH